jgi:hypothetical protein
MEKALLHQSGHFCIPLEKIFSNLPPEPSRNRIGFNLLKDLSRQRSVKEFFGEKEAQKEYAVAPEALGNL